MKVLDLQCQHGHHFEGWFGSEGDYQSQLARGLVECPLCGNSQITKKLSAPRLNLSGAREIALLAEKTNGKDQSLQAPQPAKDPVIEAMMQDPQFQAAYLKMARKIMASTEDVGNQFAQEARKIHYGETTERAIRGQASQDETLELLDEGIDITPLLLPKALKEPLQ
jgi:hypothetical protein